MPQMIAVWLTIVSVVIPLYRMLWMREADVAVVVEQLLALLYWVPLVGFRVGKVGGCVFALVAHFLA